MQINHNITALRTQNALNKANATADKHMRNLSSGLRINTAADDAAGMAIANKMKTQVKGLKRASMNAEDGISLVETAEGALGEVHSMLQRMRELAVQAANGTLEAEDRRAIQQEVEQLKEEITNTSELTEFNKITLLNGELDRRSFTDNENVSTVAYVSDTVQPGKYAYTVSSVGTQAKVEGVTSTYTGGMGGIVSINGEEATILATDTVEEAFEKMRDVCERVGITLTRDNTWGTENGGKLYLETMESGSDQSIEILGTSTLLLESFGLVTTENELIPKATGTDAVVNLIYKSDSNPDYGFDTTATVSTQGNRVVITDSNYQKIYIDLSVDEDGDALKNGTQVVASAGVTHISGVAPKLANCGGFNFTLNGKQATLNDYVIEFKESTKEVTEGGSPKVEIDTTDEANPKIIVTAYSLSGMTAPELQDALNLATTSTGITFVVGGSSTMKTADSGTTSGKITGGVKEVAEAAPSQLSLGGIDLKLNSAIGSGLNGYSFRIVEATKTELNSINGTTVTTAKAGDTKWAISGNIITIYANDISELKGKEIEKCLSGAIAKALTDNNVKKPVDEDGNVLAWTDPKVNIIDVTMQTAASKFNEKLNDLTRIAATGEEGTQGKLVTSEFVEFNVLDAGPLQLQVGANEGMKLEVQIPELTAAALGLEFINLRTEESAGHAITLCDEAIAEISAVRSKLGAYQNRLEYTISNLDVTEENTTAALSRIEDADMAYEMAEYTQRNIISQAGVSMLAQANQRPQQILQLLQ